MIMDIKNKSNQIEINERLRRKMIHAVTEYDKKQQKKQYYNKFALPQYIRGVNDAYQMMPKAGIRLSLFAIFNNRLLNCVLKSVGEPKVTKEEKMKYCL